MRCYSHYVSAGISCSICGDILQGARELGVHILAAHCDPSQRDELEKDEIEKEDDDELEDSLVIDGSPGESMEVDVDPLEEDIAGPIDDTTEADDDNDAADIPITINLPRKQTAAERRTGEQGIPHSPKHAPAEDEPHKATQRPIAVNHRLKESA